MLFRRTDKSAPAEPESVADDASKGKGRPTPTRKEAEAAARERARAGRDKKAAQKLMRERRAADNRKMREGMRAGEERYLPARDQGPVRRFIRDWVDSRITFAEFLLPALVAIMVLNYSGNPTLISFGNGLWTASILLLLVDILWMRFRLLREIRARFPDEPTKGTTFYAILRALQLRFMRMPKPRVKLGGAPKD